MDNLDIHFKRTLKVISSLKLDFKTFRFTNRDMALFTKEELLPKFITCQTNLPKEVYDTMKEIYAIEYEKKSLRNNSEEIIEIFKKEVELYKLRERLLTQPFENFSEMNFIMNPYIRTYESNWNWNQEELDKSPQLYGNILTSKEDDYYFILQQVGIFDELSESNLLELSLSEYEAYTLSLFEEPIPLLKAIEEFKKEFAINSETEELELLELTKKLIRELIFRNFIIQYNL